MNSSNLSKPVHVNKIAIILLITIAMVLGLLPYAYLVERPVLLAYGSIASFIVSLLSLIPFKTRTIESPRLLEFLLGGYSTVFFSLVATVSGSIFYWLVLGIGNFVKYLSGFFTNVIQFNPEAVAFYISLFIAGLFFLVYAYTASMELATQLYPLNPNTHSRFYSLITQEKERRHLLNGICIALPLLCVGIILAALTHVTLDTWWFNFCFFLYLIYTSLPLNNLLSKPLTSTAAITKVETQKAVQKLFRVCGYEVTSPVKTGKEEIDSLLGNIDFLAEGKEYIFAVEIITFFLESNIRKPRRSIFETVSDLLTSIWALTEDFGEKREDFNLSVKPLLVIVGREPTLKNELKEISNTFIKQIDLQVVLLSSLNLLKRIYELEDKDKLQRIASKHLSISEIHGEVKIQNAVLPSKEEIS